MSKQLPPNEALSGFAPFVGKWKTVGSHGMMPDITLQGITSFEWDDLRAYIVFKSSVEDPRFPTGMAIIGSDNELKTFMMLYYDERGISRIQNVSLEGNTLRWWRNAPNFSQRYSLTLSEDHQTIIGKGEISKNNLTWEKDLDLNYTRVAEAQ